MKKVLNKVEPEEISLELLKISKKFFRLADVAQSVMKYPDIPTILLDLGNDTREFADAILELD